MSKNPILIDIPMPIVTDRLVLRNVMPGDGKAMYDAKRESMDDLYEWMPWAKELGTEEDSEIVARENYAKFIRREDMMILGFHNKTGRLIVSTGLHRFNWEAGIFEIGYWVRSTEHGKGYATETANSLLRFAFNALGAKKIEIFHADGNEGSRKVIEKLGFIKTGYVEDDSIMNDGRHVGRHCYARYNADNLPTLDVKWG